VWELDCYLYKYIYIYPTIAAILDRNWPGVYTIYGRLYIDKTKVDLTFTTK